MPYGSWNAGTTKEYVVKHKDKSISRIEIPYKTLPHDYIVANCPTVTHYTTDKSKCWYKIERGEKL